MISYMYRLVQVSRSTVTFEFLSGVCHQDSETEWFLISPIDVELHCHLSLGKQGNNFSGKETCSVWGMCTLTSLTLKV